MRRALLVLVVLGVAGRAQAFSFLSDAGGSPQSAGASAARWSAEPDPFGFGTGLHDGIAVAVESSFADDLGAATMAQLYGVSEASVVALVHDAVSNALAAWEHAGLTFDVTFNGPVVLGPSQGFEIDLFAEPVVGTLFGYADTDVRLASSRRLTNGEELPGYVIVGADVVINATRVQEGAQLLFQLGLSLQQLANALQILITHEVGHAIGLGHPNERTFYDTDTDPYNEMTIDPAAPFADLIVSSIPADTPALLLPIMWGISSGTTEIDPVFARLSDPSLAFDDIGGRDVLYPVAAAIAIGVTAKKLIVVDKLAKAGRAKTVFVAKDAAITKGTGTDVDQIGVTFHVAYADGSASGAFVVPMGAANGWSRNGTSVARFENPEAPDGVTETKVAVIKPGKLLKLIGKARGYADRSARHRRSRSGRGAHGPLRCERRRGVLPLHVVQGVRVPSDRRRHRCNAGLRAGYRTTRAPRADRTLKRGMRRDHGLSACRPPP
jgi:hypothetical protein